MLLLASGRMGNGGKSYFVGARGEAWSKEEGRHEDRRNNMHTLHKASRHISLSLSFVPCNPFHSIYFILNY